MESTEIPSRIKETRSEKYAEARKEFRAKASLEERAVKAAEDTSDSLEAIRALLAEINRTVKPPPNRSTSY